MKSIISINNLYKLSNKDLYKIRKEFPLEKHVFKKLPRYTIRDNGKIDYAENWLQFTGQVENDTEQEFYLFNYSTTDEMMSEEFSNCGFSDFFEDFNFTELFKSLDHSTYKDWQDHKFAIQNYLLIDWEYKVYYDYYSGDSDAELIINKIEKLDLNNLK